MTLDDWKSIYDWRKGEIKREREINICYIYFILFHITLHEFVLLERWNIYCYAFLTTLKKVV